MMTSVPCPYEEAGCNFYVSKVDKDVLMQSHSTDGRKIPVYINVREHLNLRCWPGLNSHL